MARNLILLMLGFLNSCLLSTGNKGNNYTRIKIIYKSPDYIMNDKEHWFEVEKFITYNSDYTICELPYNKFYTVNDSLVYDSLKYEYFICNEMNRTGFLLNKITDSLTNKISADSILKTRVYNGNVDIADSLKTMGKATILREKISENKFLIKYYFLEHHFYDSAYFYYSNELRNIKYTISKSLDSINNAKLIKVQYFIKHDESKTPEKFKNFYINSLEIQNAPAPDEGPLKILFDRFIAVEKKSIK